MVRPSLVALLAAVLAGSAAADPADDLLRLVPPDAGVVVVVRDLRAHAGRLAASPFAGWLGRSKLLDPAERGKLGEVEQFLQTKLGSTSQQLVDDVFGDAVVLAYRPGPPGKPADDAGLVLLHARDPAKLTATLDKLTALQRESGELTGVADRSHAGAGYLERRRADGGREYVLRAGPVLAFSAQEALVRGVIDRRAVPPTRVAPAADSLRRLGASDALGAAWFHPPALAADLHAQRDAATDPTQRAVLTQTAAVWAACDGLALFARPDRDLSVGLVASVDPAKLPPAVRPLLFPAPGGSAWGAVPADALLAIGGRFDLPAARAAVASFLPAGDATLAAGLADGLGPLVGRQNLEAVLKGVGPEWVAWAEAPATGWVPDWTLAVRLSPAARRPVLQALDFGVGLLRLGYNRDHVDQLDLGEDARDGRTVKFLQSAALAPNQQPAYGEAAGFLVLASSPERVHRFAPGTAADPPLARLDAAKLRAFLADRRDAAAVGLAAQNGRPVADLRRELDGLAAVLQVVNRVELTQLAGDGLIRLTLQIQPVEPLR